jgi:hypothetical protein
MSRQAIKPFMKIDRLKSVFWGLLFMAGGFLLWHYLVGNPFNELALIRRGVTTTGSITNVQEVVDEVGPRGKLATLRYATYVFRLPTGRIISASANDVKGTLPDDLSHVEVEYLPDDPTVNRIRGIGSATVAEWLWRTVGIGGLLLAMSLSTGVYIIYREFYPKPEN